MVNFAREIEFVRTSVGMSRQKEWTAMKTNQPDERVGDASSTANLIARRLRPGALVPEVSCVRIFFVAFYGEKAGNFLGRKGKIRA